MSSKLFLEKIEDAKVADQNEVETPIIVDNESVDYTILSELKQELNCTNKPP